MNLAGEGADRFFAARSTKTSFSKEIEEFNMSQQPTNRAAVTERIKLYQESITERKKSQQLTIFGSFATKLNLLSSDVDLCLAPLGADSSRTELQGLSSRRLRQILPALKHLYQSFVLIFRAKIPVLKLIDNTGLPIDISFARTPNTSHVLVKQLVGTHSVLHINLILFLKMLLLKWKLNDPSEGGIGGYAVTLWVHAFLQIHKGIYGDIQGESFGSKRHLNNLSNVLMNFLHFFGYIFDYHNTCLKINLSLDEGVTLMSKKDSSMINYKKPYLLCIIDPQTGLNVAKACTRIREVVDRFCSVYKLILSLRADEISNHGYIYWILGGKAGYRT